MRSGSLPWRKLAILWGIALAANAFSVAGFAQKAGNPEIEIHSDHGDSASSFQLKSGDIKYGAAHAGVLGADLVGDRDKAGVYIIRVKLLAGSRIEPHYHPDGRFTTVLSGTLYLGLSDQFDPAKTITITAGSSYYTPAKQAHYVWAKDGEVVYEETGFGPSKTIPIKPE